MGRHRQRVVVIDHKAWVAQGRDVDAQVDSVRCLFGPYDTRGHTINTINRGRISRLMDSPGGTRGNRDW